MRIVYNRQDSCVSVDGVAFFEPDKPVDVPDEVGEALVKSGLFEEHKKQKRR